MPESCGKMNPSTVLLKTGLIKGGIEALKVRMKKDDGQNKCVSIINKIFFNFTMGLICGVTKNFLNE